MNLKKCVYIHDQPTVTGRCVLSLVLCVDGHLLLAAVVCEAELLLRQQEICELCPLHVCVQGQAQDLLRTLWGPRAPLTFTQTNM